MYLKPKKKKNKNKKQKTCNGKKVVICCAGPPHMLCQFSKFPGSCKPATLCEKLQKWGEKIIKGNHWTR
jgi:hypothetical protein